MRKSLIAVLAIASVAFISSCGTSGGSDSASADKPEATTTTTEAVKTVAVDAWAQGFCGNFKTWSQAMQTASDSVDGSATPGDIESGKAALSGLFEAASTATQTLITSLEQGGAPDIDDGDQLVEDLTGKFEAVDAAAQKAKTNSEALDSADAAAFATDAEELATQFQAEVQTVADSFDEIDTKYPDSELNDALVAHCT